VCHFGVKSLNGGDFLRLCGLSVLGFRLCGVWFSVMRCLVFGYAVFGFRLCGAWFYGYAVAVWRLCFRLWREGEMKAAERLCRSADIEV